MTLRADMWSCREAEEELFAVQEIKQRLFPKEVSTESLCLNPADRV